MLRKPFGTNEPDRHICESKESVAIPADGVPVAERVCGWFNFEVNKKVYREDFLNF